MWKVKDGQTEDGRQTTRDQVQQSQDMAKIFKSYILTLAQPKGHVMSVKCEEPIDELTVQVWLLYHHPIFKYCTL